MASKFAVVASVAVVEGLLLVGVGVFAAMQRTELQNSVAALREIQDSNEFQRRMSEAEAAAKAATQSLAQQHNPPQTSAPPSAVSGRVVATILPQPVNGLSDDQAAANRRAQWAREHAAQIAAARGESPDQSPPFEPAAHADSQAAGLEEATKLAEQKARDYFYHHWRPGNNSVKITNLEITLSEVVPKPGWPGQWDVSGEAFVEYYTSSGGSFSSSNIKFYGDLAEDELKISHLGVSVGR